MVELQLLLDGDARVHGGDGKGGGEELAERTAWVHGDSVKTVCLNSSGTISVRHKLILGMLNRQSNIGFANSEGKFSWRVKVTTS
ncbi:hypothetical protein GCM10027317_41070 [Massilia agri]